MNLSEVVAQASWRMRAYLFSPETDTRLVGWRRDACACPLAEWLLFEETRDLGFYPEEQVTVDVEWIIWHGTIIATPPVLARFIQILDSRESALFCGESTRVDRREALEALLLAERQAGQHLISEHAESLSHCDYRMHGLICGRRAATPLIYGFLDTRPQLHLEPQRDTCRIFIGRLCEEHWGQVVVPPRSWWPVAEGSLELVEV